MKQILVTAGVIIKDNLILLAQRSDGDEAGKWEFPGGKVEPGEDPRACLKRELQEELGVDTEVGRVLDLVSVSQKDRHLVLVYFQCEIKKGEPKPLQCSQVKWFRRDEAELLQKPQADHILWEKIFK